MITKLFADAYLNIRVTQVSDTSRFYETDRHRVTVQCDFGGKNARERERERERERDRERQTDRQRERETDRERERERERERDRERESFKI